MEDGRGRFVPVAGSNRDNISGNSDKSNGLLLPYASMVSSTASLSKSLAAAAGGCGVVVVCCLDRIVERDWSVGGIGTDDFPFGIRAVDGIFPRFIFVVIVVVAAGATGFLCDAGGCVFHWGVAVLLLGDEGGSNNPAFVRNSDNSDSSLRRNNPNSISKCHDRESSDISVTE